MKLTADYATISAVLDNYYARNSYRALHYDSVERPYENYSKAHFKFVRDQRTCKWETIHDVVREQIESWNTGIDVRVGLLASASDMFTDIEFEEPNRDEIIAEIADQVILVIVRELERIIGTLPILESSAVTDLLNIGGKIELYGIHINYLEDVKKLQEVANA